MAIRRMLIKWNHGLRPNKRLLLKPDELPRTFLLSCVHSLDVVTAVDSSYIEIAVIAESLRVVGSELINILLF